MNLERPGSNDAIGTRNRSRDVAFSSGLCTRCTEDCTGNCDIFQASMRGREVIYPGPFGEVTAGGDKDYPVDYSHLNIHGYALGGGLELAMGADFRYVSDDASVGQPEIKLGIIPGAGGTQRLPRIIGFQKAKELNFSGRHVKAEEALEIGLADKVFPVDHLLPATLAEAEKYATGPTVAIGAARRAMNEGWGRPIDEAMEVEAQAFADCFWTEDAKEGVAAFIDKRKAEFTGS